MVGAKIVMPGPHLDPASLSICSRGERVTITGGVPTIWMGVLQYLDAQPGRVRSVRACARCIVGGSAVPRAMIEAFERARPHDRARLGHDRDWRRSARCGHLPARWRTRPTRRNIDYRAKQGRPSPFVEIRARNEDGLVPWDGETMGELEVRGPWIASAITTDRTATDRFTDDGWFAPATS